MQCDQPRRRIHQNYVIHPNYVMHPNIEAMWGVDVGPGAVAGVFRGWSVAGLATPINPWLVWAMQLYSYIAI